MGALILLAAVAFLGILLSGSSGAGNSTYTQSRSYKPEPWDEDTYGTNRRADAKPKTYDYDDDPDDYDRDVDDYDDDDDDND